MKCGEEKKIYNDNFDDKKICSGQYTNQSRSVYCKSSCTQFVGNMIWYDIMANCTTIYLSESSAVSAKGRRMMCIKTPVPTRNYNNCNTHMQHSNSVKKHEHYKLHEMGYIIYYWLWYLIDWYTKSISEHNKS